MDAQSFHLKSVGAGFECSISSYREDGKSAFASLLFVCQNLIAVDAVSALLECSANPTCC